jgi:lipopolysaccharide/colanic/teichoic acid biosynthesis glycosyltransferase
VFDVVIAGGVLLILSPVWLMIGLLVRLTSSGPALFRTTVIGRGGRPFKYYKFRSMVAGDDSHHRAWLRDFVIADAPYHSGQFKVTDDHRITAVGRILRRTSLDEIPQLINVLKGDMSVVGPRPPIPYEFDLYDTRARARMKVKPGITGLYQVTGRSEVPFSRMLELDLEFIDKRSVWLYLSIVTRTFGTVLSGRGAG